VGSFSGRDRQDDVRCGNSGTNPSVRPRMWKAATMKQQTTADGLHPQSGSKCPNGTDNGRPGGMNRGKGEPLSFWSDRFEVLPQARDYGPTLYQATGAATSRTNRRLSPFWKRGVFDDDHTAAMASRAFSTGWLGLEFFGRHFLPRSPKLRSAIATYTDARATAASRSLYVCPRGPLRPFRGIVTTPRAGGERLLPWRLGKAGEGAGARSRRRCLQRTHRRERRHGVPTWRV
jgi:hypothetical protein